MHETDAQRVTKIESQRVARYVIGLNEDDAKRAITGQSLRSRVIKRNGVSLVGTRDYRVDRINLTIQDGKVVKADIG